MASAAPSNGRKPALKCPATRGTVKHRPGMFGKDLPHIMYGYGDASTPMKESVDLMERMVTEYISGMTNLALDEAGAGASGKVTYEHFIFPLRGDTAKFQRVQELLIMDHEIKESRRIKAKPVRPVRRPRKTGTRKRRSSTPKNPRKKKGTKAAAAAGSGKEGGAAGAAGAS